MAGWCRFIPNLMGLQLLDFLHPNLAADIEIPVLGGVYTDFHGMGIPVNV